MKLAWMSGETSRCYLDACAARVTMGISLLPVDKDTFRVPAIEIEYNLRELLPVSVILKAMKDSEDVPEVYVWDTEAAEPEVAVVFQVRNPSLPLLRDIVTKSASLIVDTIYELGCEELFTTAEVNIPRPGVQVFLNAFTDLGMGIVVVHDTKQGDRYDPDTAFRFLVKSVTRSRPKLLDF